MFSSGNITEKLRIASFNCSGETVVDLYAGIGYLTLHYLVHAGASFVHACEQNPHAVNALRRNLELNGAAQRCQVHQGDNRQKPNPALLLQNLCLQEVSDPSSPAWKATRESDTADSRESAPGLDRRAVKADWQAWSKAAACRIAALLLEIQGQPWRTHILHIEHVKAYAPHVDHIVLDLDCRPICVVMGTCLYVLETKVDISN
ncbi:tRNA wybutosine-synthesizing protein 2 homolog isoform X2 [Polyodon spathula]|uniref:tRNA wybutosine-synthesizing protein 2 homolog isoform X2 n=1 Tax=Polyodon spathula TaxID=7913 RepID=UPI001B7F7317|nr:tRNA wybutosine-synthesizing protein 2 homolog isoform X2 [Polyodon spathula]